MIPQGRGIVASIKGIYMPRDARTSGVLQFDLFEVDLRAGELHKAGRRIKLQVQPFRALEMFLEHPGEVVTREEFQRRLWPADTFVDFDHSLNTAIKKLRQALCDDAKKPRFIETLPRRGYRFIAPVSGSQPAGISGPCPATLPLRSWRHGCTGSPRNCVWPSCRSLMPTGPR